MPTIFLFAVLLAAPDSLVAIKADPISHLRKEIVLEGAWQLGDYYNYGYEKLQRTHACYRFFEVGENGKLKEDVAYLYMNREIGADVTKSMVAYLQTKGSNDAGRRVRVKARLTRYFRGKQWNMLELMDVQFIDDGQTGPWMMQEARQEHEAREAAAEALANQPEPEPEYEDSPREWSGATGKFSVRGTYKGFESGRVILETEEGKTIKVVLSGLSKKDREYVKARRKGELPPGYPQRGEMLEDL